MLTIQEHEIEVTALNRYSEIYVADQLTQNPTLIHKAKHLAPLVSPESEGVQMASQAVICVDDPNPIVCERIKVKVLTKLGAY
jgi:transaldolase